MPKTLIVRACAIGDFVLNIPALLALQESESDTRFTLVGNPSSLELASEFVNVDGVRSIEVQPWARLFYEPIVSVDFERAIVWMKDPVVAANLAASGVERVIRADSFPSFGHAADHLLRTLGLPRPPLPDLWKPSGGEIAIHPGSGSAKKNWPYFDALMKQVPEAQIIPQNLSLPDLSRYLRTVRAFVGNDSGITHLAAYLGCPTIALFGPTDPRVWGPIGRRSRILWKTKLEDITVNEVLNIIHETNTGTGIDG